MTPSRAQQLLVDKADLLPELRLAERVRGLAAAVPALRERRRVERDRLLLRRLHRKPREQVERGRRRGVLRRGGRVDAEEVCVPLGARVTNLRSPAEGSCALAGCSGVDSFERSD